MIDPKPVPRAVRTFAVAAIMYAAWWALKPLPKANLPLPDLSLAHVAEPTSNSGHFALDTRGFSIPLWVAPPAPPSPPAPAAPPPPPPPLKLQLIAIVREAGDGEATGGNMRVMLYDPETDRVLNLREGDAVEGSPGRLIATITLVSVQIQDPPTRDGREPVVRTLALTDALSSAGVGR